MKLRTKSGKVKKTWKSGIRFCKAIKRAFKGSSINKYEIDEYGLYDVDAFHNAMKKRFKESAILYSGKDAILKPKR